MTGTLYVFDGIDGCGKSTLVRNLAAKRGALMTREPGGSPSAERIRALILHDDSKGHDAETNFALFWASRRDHIVQTVLPALDAGKDIFSDRFDSSTWAFQIRGQEQSQLEKLFWDMRAHYMAGIATKTRYCFLDVSPEIGFARTLHRRGERTHFDDRDQAFYTRVRQGFLEFGSRINALPAGNRAVAVIVDAHPPADEVEAAVVRDLF